MDECLIFTVKVAHEVLGPLGELEQRLNPDDLAGRRRDGGVFLGQQVHIAKLLGAGIFSVHGQSRLSVGLSLL